MASYIYAIICTRHGKALVGYSKKPAKRLREHRCLLNQGKHAEPHLQADWLEYGQHAFLLRVIDELPDNATVADKRAAELGWMDFYAKMDALYNTRRISFQPPAYAIPLGIEAARHVAGNRWTAETNQKRRLAQLGIPKGHGAKISATKRAKRAAMLMR
jgi:hypothetical protein